MTLSKRSMTGQAGGDSPETPVAGRPSSSGAIPVELVPERVTIDAVVIRAGGERVDLGTIADSRRRWRYGPARLFAARRIRKANRELRRNN